MPTMHNFYPVFSAGDDTTALAQLESCFEEIQQWMTVSMLKLNDNKIELMVIGSKCSSQNLPQIPSPQVEENGINSVSTMKNILQ